MELHDSIYTDIVKDKKFDKTLKKIAAMKMTGPLYLVTLPIHKYGLLEIYSYDELLQHYYRRLQEENEIIVVGISESRTGAKSVVCDIIEDCLKRTGGLDISGFFAERASL